MPPTQFKLNNYVAVRSFVFDAVFGQPEAQMGMIQFNNHTLFGVSGEISGEIITEIEHAVVNKSLNCIPTSFNGDYIGYLTHPSLYHSREHTETRDLNFYGPQNTNYFIRLSQLYLNKMNPNN